MTHLDSEDLARHEQNRTEQNRTKLGAFAMLQIPLLFELLERRRSRPLPLTLRESGPWGFYCVVLAALVRLVGLAILARLCWSAGDVPRA